ncbi:hypothetical protein D3C77_49100 [compost metagenome]
MKIGILGALGGIGASMLKALAVSTGSFTSVNTGPRGGKRSKVRSYLYVPAQQPEAKRHWHDPKDPVQAARIEAAAAKRVERARKLARNTGRATFHNHCHGIHCIASNWQQSLNPTFVAK